MAEIATGSSDDAMDLLQDSMIAFVQRYASRNSDEWPPLFFRILQNRIRDWYRWSKVRNKWRVWFGGDKDAAEDSSSFIENQPDNNATNPLHNLQDNDFGEALLDALQDLPLRQQQAFMLRTWEGLSVLETAQAMQCSEGSVKTHLSRANKALREKLEDYQ